MGFVFDPAEHAYYLDGRRLPSVTQILQAAALGTDYSMVPPAILEHKRQVGVAVHAACRMVDEDDLDETTIADEIRPYVDGYRAFITDTGFRAMGTELALYDDVLGYAGTPDVWGDLNGRFALLDRKTLWTLDVPTAALQAAGYAPLIEALEPAWRGAERFALHLQRTGRYRLVPAAIPAADATFLAALYEARGEGTDDTAAILRHWKEHYAPRNCNS